MSKRKCIGENGSPFIRMQLCSELMGIAARPEKASFLAAMLIVYSGLQW